jgi:hypothetical protein
MVLIHHVILIADDAAFKLVTWQETAVRNGRRNTTNVDITPGICTQKGAGKRVTRI